ncbi:AzlC family ABC transporter permease [Nocardiopsis sp. MG754419]|uniref:AzlC family ABC transporter permease n=1 Tax=Nocardiopsis sp. MG754419 TaxID=2259865 RepID=UPI001BA4B95B|nr:AzlC family ABC transporter permease [Nocardiopsis sp. MG754419]MBR8743228.1 branched-chain amino acid ABC transporter permease [Nocardiopsis sp. MG754419]
MNQRTSTAVPSGTPIAEIGAGVRASLAAGLGMVPLGVAFGLMVVQAGLPWWVAPALSVAAFAGSLELLLVGMVATATPLAAVALTTFLVNFRHVFYAVSFPLHVVRHPLARAYSVYALIDEAYAVTAASSERWTSWRLLSLQIAFQVYWVGGGLVGVLLASLAPGRIEGLEFALCALFVTLTLDACRGRAQVPSLLLAGTCFTAALVIAPDSALFVGLLLFVLALVGRYLLTGRRTTSDA